MRTRAMTIGPDFSRTLAAAKTGAEWAWATIYRDLAGPVSAYLAAQGAAEPEDLTSETFLQAARDITGFEGDEQGFRSWIFVIAHRRLIDSWRAAGRRPRQSAHLDGVAEPLGGDAEEEALQGLMQQELLSALARLTDDQRAVLTLRIVADLTLVETAKVLGRRVGAIKALQRRALLTLERSITGLE